MTDSPYQVMPPLSADEREALKTDIAERGVMVPVEYDEDGKILDGHHRVELCGELGITHWPRLIRYGLSESEKRRHARRLNVDRRHLDQAQRRKMIEDDLRETPEASNRKIAAGLGVDDKTVGVVRTKLESTAEIPQLDKREGRDKKVRKIVQYVDPSPEGVRGSKMTARTISHAERENHRENARELARALSERTAELSAMDRKFSVVYADPPWRRKAGFTDRSYENHFPTMTWPDIIGLPVKDRLLPDAWCFLWIPRAHLLALHPVEIDTPLGRTTVKLPLAWAVAQAWGFDAYSTCFVWTKTDDDHPDDMGSGLIVRDQDEILLLFKRGRGMPMPATDEKVGSNYRERSKPLGHSRKPEFYRQMIRTMVGAGVPVFEMFARVDDEHPLPPDFYAWGNQSGQSIPPDIAVDTVDEPFDPVSGELSPDSTNGAAENATPGEAESREAGSGTSAPPSVSAASADTEIGSLSAENGPLTERGDAQPEGGMTTGSRTTDSAGNAVGANHGGSHEDLASKTENANASKGVTGEGSARPVDPVTTSDPEAYPGWVENIVVNEFEKPPRVDLATDGGPVSPATIADELKRFRASRPYLAGAFVTIDSKPYRDPEADQLAIPPFMRRKPEAKP